VKDPHTGIAAARRLQRALDALDAKLAEVLGDDCACVAKDRANGE